MLRNALFITKNLCNKEFPIVEKLIMMHRMLLNAIKFNRSFSACLSTTVPPATATARKTNEFPAKLIDDAIEKRPQLKNFTRNQWQQTFETLTGQGFNIASFMTIVGKRPQLLRRSPEKLVQSIECLRCTNFESKLIFELVEKNPEYLEFNNIALLREKMSFLKWLAKTEINIFRILCASPNVLAETEQCTKAKMDYMTQVMRLDETQASKSSAFSYSLDEIKLRHVFLDRLGLFKPKNPKVSALQPSKNPKTSSIFDCTDREFATKTCGVTVEEFETFRELYQREKHRHEKNVDEEHEE
ncbi:transcription termination factor 4, mitochondrial [Bradysia coprophila]|uniref:transcription termination factor 4, mitochondrial n=1 Tax=Bradysia coprophila TaxID=38358 RepID=UPI00187D865A|nr:transcription termination factor 4, mitochondrial [Bradysia coprophila]